MTEFAGEQFKDFKLRGLQAPLVASQLRRYLQVKNSQYQRIVEKYSQVQLKYIQDIQDPAEKKDLTEFLKIISELQDQRQKLEGAEREELERKIKELEGKYSAILVNHLDIVGKMQDAISPAEIQQLQDQQVEQSKDLAEIVKLALDNLQKPELVNSMTAQEFDEFIILLAKDNLLDYEGFFLSIPSSKESLQNTLTKYPST